MAKCDFSFKECTIMVSILKENLGNPSQLTVSKIASAIGVSASNTRLCNVMKYLAEVNIIKQIDTVGSCKIISIDKKKLIELINMQELLIPIFKFYEDRHILVVGNADSWF